LLIFVVFSHAVGLPDALTQPPLVPIIGAFGGGSVSRTELIHAP